MCGIFALLNIIRQFTSNLQLNIIHNEFMKGRSRGPEFSKLETTTLNKNIILGFHRLAINGLNEKSNQPFYIEGVMLVCNGEIYNYKQLYEYLGIEPVTDSDCEVIIHLYLLYGIEQTLLMLDGVFAFVLYDTRKELVYTARDPFGVRPLYELTVCNQSQTQLISQQNYTIGFASELKTLSKFIIPGVTTVTQFKPSTYSVYEFNSKLICPNWSQVTSCTYYFIPSFSYKWLINEETTAIDDLFANIWSKISGYLVASVNKRCNTTERPIACLLSGGLDSSLIAALVNNYFKCQQSTSYVLETYSIGLEGSEDLKYAKIVADYLQTKHTEIIVTEQDMFDAIPAVIKAIESYDTTTVRASIGNYLLGKYIAKNSKAKVIFNGDGADELLGGYLYMNKCPDDIEFDKETRRLLTDIHLFDVLRSDKSISSNGLEPRTPFLDKSFVNFITSLPPVFRNHNHHNNGINNIEKYILRNSFSKEHFTNFEGTQILPDEILWRKKEAFSDGVSSKGRSLYQILQEKIACKLTELAELGEPGEQYNACIETEKSFYKHMFLVYYPNSEAILPYYWMPRYTVATDPSARTLTIYSN
jgi:asparagine synthase (glutamine-hydrolysing)